MYKPPLGRLGLELDDAFLYGMAEVTMKDLAKSISRQLEKATA